MVRYERRGRIVTGETIGREECNDRDVRMENMRWRGAEFGIEGCNS